MFKSTYIPNGYIDIIKTENLISNKFHKNKVVPIIIEENVIEIDSKVQLNMLNKLQMNKIFTIAEIGINHNGDLSIAKKLIDLAKRTGFDLVKFQKRDIETVYDKNYLSEPRKVHGAKLNLIKKKVLNLVKKNT